MGRSFDMPTRALVSRYSNARDIPFTSKRPGKSTRGHNRRFLSSRSSHARQECVGGGKTACPPVNRPVGPFAAASEDRAAETTPRSEGSVERCSESCS